MAATDDATTKAATPLQVVRGYFEAATARDAQAMGSFWALDGVEVIHGTFEGRGPAAVEAFFDGVFRAMPDFALVVDHTVTQRDRVAVHWHATATFTGAPFQGIAATGARLELTGIDLLQVREGKIVRNDAYMDGMGFARQLGLVPPQGSKQESRLNALFNRKTALTRRITAAPEQIAEDVWIVRGGFPTKGMSVFLVRDTDGGVFAFDAGIRQMAPGIATAAAQLGGLSKVVLGHAHPDHRGAAPSLHAPVYVHQDELEAAEGTGRMEEVTWDRLPFGSRQAFGALLPYWDGGPVQVAGTLVEGDVLGDGWRVVTTPGHSAGQIALFRERDRIALTSDTFYTVDPVTLRHGEPRVPHPAFTPDQDTARASIRKIAELEPSIAWPGHADPVTGDVKGRLLRAGGAA
jgi:steroid delta-isomerase-like uncharacterized protein